MFVQVWDLSHIMQRLDLLTGLPTSVACSVLRDWLDCKSVATLNSAWCSKSSRTTFLHLVQSDEYFLHQEVTISSKSKILNALKVIGDQIRSVKLGEITFKEGLLVAKHCHKLKHVRTCSSLRYNPHIMSRNLLNILKNNQCVQSLSLMCLVSSDQALAAPSFHNLKLTQLNALVLIGFEIENERILCLMKKCNIKKLDLSHSYVSPSVLLSILKYCPNLTALGLSQTSLCDDAHDAITTACPNIMHIDISYAGGGDLTDVGILCMVRNLKNLQSLNVAYLPIFTSASLRHIFTHCASTLHTLYLTDVNDPFGFGCFDDEVINELLERCGNLHTLMLNVRRAGDDGMFLMTKPRVIQNLTTLLLLGDAVNAHNVREITKYGAKLEVLSIQVEDAELEEQILPLDPLLSVYNTCTRLRRLYIHIEEGEETRTMKYAQAFLKLWEQTRPGLVIEHDVVREFKFPLMTLE